MLYAIRYVKPNTEIRVLLRYPKNNYPATFMTRKGAEEALLALDPREHPHAHVVEAAWVSGFVNHHCECSVCRQQPVEVEA